MINCDICKRRIWPWQQWEEPPKGKAGAHLLCITRFTTQVIASLPIIQDAVKEAQESRRSIAEGWARTKQMLMDDASLK